MRKIFLLFLGLSVICFSACSYDNPVVATKFELNGVFVLYEGTSNGGGDYSFIDIKHDSVLNDIFGNSNGGMSLNLQPHSIYLYVNQNIYIVARGPGGMQGSVYKINAANNQLITSRDFGRNPYGLLYLNQKLYISNSSASSVTVFDLDLNMVRDSIEVGPNPAQVAYAIGNIFVAKLSTTPERSLAVMDVITYGVQKIFFNYPPISAAVNTGGMYVSTYTGKKLYLLDSLSNVVSDSISVTTANTAIGEVIAGNPLTLYVVGGSAIAGGIEGREVLAVNLQNSPPSVSILIPAGTGGLGFIYGIAYESLNKEIYLADIRGKVFIYDASTGAFKKLYDIGGPNPAAFAFKYQ